MLIGRFNMRVVHEILAGRRLDGPRVSRTAIVLSGLALLGTSATIAWSIRGTVTPATAQSGPQIAARTPERDYPAPEVTAVPRRATGRALTIDRLVIEPDTPTLVSGSAPALSSVSIHVGGRLIATSLASPSGTWEMTIERALGAGDHRVNLRAIPLAGGDVITSEVVRLSVPHTLVGRLVIALGAGNETPRAATAVATGEFAAVALEQDGRTLVTTSTVPTVRLAQAQPAPSSDPLEIIRDWMRRSERDYQDVGVKGVSTPPPGASAPDKPAVVASPPRSQSQPAQPAPTAPAGKSVGVIDSVMDWFRGSSESYQTTVNKGLTEPTGTPGAPATPSAASAPTAPPPVASTEPARTPEVPKPAAAPESDESKKVAQTKAADDVKRRAEETLRAAQAQRDAELKAAETKRVEEQAAVPKAPEPPKAADDTAARKAAEDKRIADETLKRQADLRAAEERRAVEQKRASDEAAARAADASKKTVDDPAKRQADQKAAEDRRMIETRAAQEAAAKAAEQQVEAKRQADQRAAAEASAKAAAQQAEAKRVADERATADARRRALELAEAAVKSPPRVPQQPDGANLPPLPSVSTRPAPLPGRIDAPTPRTAQPAVAPAPAASSLPPLPSVSTRAGAPPSPPAVASPRLGQAQQPADPPGTLSKSGRSSLGFSAPRAGNSLPTVGSAACRKAGRKITPPGYYVVRDGDTLWDIADKHYADGAKLNLLQQGNPGLSDIDLILPCQRVYVPARSRG
jgi:hypothetical protein